jgi:hypothetical protein
MRAGLDGTMGWGQELESFAAATRS